MFIDFGKKNQTFLKDNYFAQKLQMLFLLYLYAGTPLGTNQVMCLNSLW